LHFTFLGLIIAAGVQPAKVLNSILGNGIFTKTDRSNGGCAKSANNNLVN
jgi:hypothetical protein